MRILHVTKKYPDALGGDTVVVANLQAHQYAAGHQVTILTSNCDEIRDGKNIYKFGLHDTPATLDSITIKRLISLIALFFKAFSVIRKEKPDIIHTHSIDMAFCVSFAARWFRIPILHTFHIVTFNDPQQSAFRRLSELRLTKVANPQVVTAPNEYDVMALTAAGVNRTCLLPNGVDLDFWQPQQLTKTSKDFVFCSIGRLEPQKGYEYLIKAAALLKRNSQQKFRILLIGDGKQLQQLKTLAQSLGVANIIEFMGRKTPREIRTIISKADATVFPSLYETTPITLLEAWAMKTPVIITPVGIMRNKERAKKLAFMAQPGDEKTLQTALKDCLSNEEERKKKVIAATKEVKKYTWSDISQRTENIYGSII